MRLAQRIAVLEKTYIRELVTLQLKDGSVSRIADEALWDTFFEVQKMLGGIRTAQGEGRNDTIPQWAFDQIPMLRAILDTVSHDAGHQAVELIRAVCVIAPTSSALT